MLGNPDVARLAGEREGEGREGRRALLRDDVFPLPRGLVVLGWTGLLRGGRGKIVRSGEGPRKGR